MTTNIKQLTNKRKRWVEANRENGFENGIKLLLTNLYPDNAHFIYELLQNAEDAGASEVRFTLKDDRVKFEHNGERLFSMKDVKSITSIGESTKKDDPTSIGKFGIGFKAVFAYTSTPEIQSGDYHFCIHDLVVPDTEGISPSLHGQMDTCFVIPFDNPSKPPEIARAEIEYNLGQLNENTLLFLSNIKKLEYHIPDSTPGLIERIQVSENRVEISVQHPEKPKSVSSVFLRFEKEVVVFDNNESKSCRIAVAFSLENMKDQDADKLDNKGLPKQNVQWRIAPLLPGKVSIYFPADKETSNLRFHLHAPFASTVARDSVRDCQANNQLRDYLAVLIAESMISIRDQGLLTVGFLATLPNHQDNLPSFYKPILNSLIKTFRNEELTPMKTGGHAAASGIFGGLVQLSNLIVDDDFANIMGEDYFPPMWVANPPQRNQREGNFLAMLKITEWTTDEFVRKLASNRDKIVTLFDGKSDKWHQQLYALFGEYYSNISAGNIMSRIRKNMVSELCIIRINNGTYSIGSKCYFPDDSIENDDLMPRIAKGIYTSGSNTQQQEKARKYLEDIGVREVGEPEIVEAILNDRYSQDAVVRKAFKPEIKDIKRFIAFVDKYPSQSGLFGDYYLFMLSNGKWGKPSEVYLDSPYTDTGLTNYFGKLEDTLQEKDNFQYWALSKDYKKCGIKPEKVGEFAIKLGALHNLPIRKVDCGKDYHCDYSIVDLDNLFEKPTVGLSRLVWQTMNNSDEKYLKTLNRTSDFGFVHADSQLLQVLKNAVWIPQDCNKFVHPSNAYPEQLPKGFPYDKGQQWIEAIEFGSNIKKQSEEYGVRNDNAQQMGFASADEAEKMVEIADLCKQQGKTLDDLISKLTPDMKKTKPSFPERTVANPVRRKDRLTDQLTDATSKEYRKRNRSVRISRGTIDPAVWLREQYTNNAEQMVCQICKEEMPFRKRDGDYYFEAVEAFSKEHLIKEHDAQYLALCPTCAAMYKEFIKSDEDTMVELKNMFLNTDSNDFEVSIHLGKLKTSIRFVEVHLHDIKSILDGFE